MHSTSTRWSCCEAPDGVSMEVSSRSTSASGKVRVRLEQFLALAPGIRLEQRCQRPFADELTDSFTDAGGGGENRIHVRAAHTFGELRAPRQAIVRDMQGFQGDLGLLIVCTRALATHPQGKASPKDHPVSRVVVRVGEFER